MLVSFAIIKFQPSLKNREILYRDFLLSFKQFEFICESQTCTLSIDLARYLPTYNYVIYSHFQLDSYISCNIQ